MTGHLIFLAFSALIAVLAVVSRFHYISILFMLVYLLRLICLKKRDILKWSLLIFALMTMLTELKLQDKPSVLSSEDQFFLVDIKMDSVKVDGDLLQFYGKEGRGEDLVVFYRLTSEEEKEYWLKEVPASQLAIKGQLEEGSGHRNFFDFSYRSFLRQKNIHWILQAEDLSIKEKDWKVWRMDHWRQQIFQWIDQCFSSPAAPYIKALIFSDQRYFDKQLYHQFKQMGVVHLLSISGMHISFFINLFRYFLLRAGLTKEKIPPILIMTLTLYGCLCGWGISIFRAICQHNLRSLKHMCAWPLTSFDIWSFTLVAALLIQPLSILQVGFQLSYLLSFSLIFYQHLPLTTYLNSWQTELFLSLYAAVWSLPVLIYHHHSFSILSVFFNLLMIPIFSKILLPLLLLSLTLAICFGQLSAFHYLDQLLNIILNSFEVSLTIFEDFTQWQWVTGHVPWFLLAAIFLLTVQMMKACETRKQFSLKKIVWPTVLILIILLSQSFPFWTRVLVVNVGQGDCIIVQQAFWQSDFMIDTGGRLKFEKEEWQEKNHKKSMAEDRLIPALHSLGISHLDYLFISHGDADHCGDMLDLIDGFSVGQVQIMDSSLKHEGFFQQVKQAYQSGQDIQLIPTSAIPYSLADHWTIIWPKDELEDVNDGSMVIYGKIANDSWMFTGDISQKVENELLSSYPSLDVDILKVGHHGSDTSTGDQWLKQLAAHTAIISVGENNRYHHPSPEVVDRLEQYGVRTLRTDIDGAILFTYYPWLSQPHIQTVKNYYKEE